MEKISSLPKTIILKSTQKLQITTVIKPMLLKTKNNYCNISYFLLSSFSYSSSLSPKFEKLLTPKRRHSVKYYKNLSFLKQKNLLKLTLNLNKINYNSNKSYNSVKSLLHFLSHLNVL